MSLKNRKRQYRMFMERGETELAEQQIRDKPELLKEIEDEDNSKKEPEDNSKSKVKK